MKKIFTLVITILVIAFTSKAQGTWTQKENLPAIGRYGAISFSIDDKGYLGTGDDNNVLYKDFWEYDPSTNVWTQKADFGGTVLIGGATFTLFGKGYVGTGSDAANHFTKQFWEYDPITNTWIQKADFAGAGRYQAVGFSINGKGYIGTGINGGCCPFNLLKDFWEYDPTSDTWTQKSDFGGGIRGHAAGFSIGNKGYIGTGQFNPNTGLNKKDLWEYDPTSDTWAQKADFGGEARAIAFGFSIGSKGYIGTGVNGIVVFRDFWEYDTMTDSWSAIADYGGSEVAYARGFSVNGKGYVGTGANGADAYKDLWEFTPDTSCSPPSATITPLGNLDICNTGFVKLQASSGNNYTYQWNRNNVDVPGATNQIFKANKTGNYRVRIVSGKGCNSVSKKTTVYTSCKLAEEELNSSLNLFPNPTTGTFTLDLKLNDEENSQAIIQVLNMLGQVVYDETTSLTNGVLQKEIKLSDATADGMYLVKVTINDQVFSSQINYQK